MAQLACEVLEVILALGQAILLIGCRTVATGLMQDKALCHIRAIPITENWAGSTVIVAGQLIPLEEARKYIEIGERVDQTLNVI